jgi:hypothetical protein
MQKLTTSLSLAAEGQVAQIMEEAPEAEVSENQKVRLFLEQDLH